jgi:hypothetical protein
MRINRTTLVDDTDQILREAHRLRSNAKNSLAGPDHMLAKAERLERIHEILEAILMHRSLEGLLCLSQLPDDIGTDTWTLHPGPCIELSRAIERCASIEEALDAAPGFCAEESITECFVSRERPVETRRVVIRDAHLVDGGQAQLEGAA